MIVPTAQRTAVARGLAEALPRGTVGVGGTALDARVSVLTVLESKGLEFDQVVVVEPSALLAEGALGAHDLYVALTRPTQQLVVLHTEPLPPGFVEEGVEASLAVG